MNQVDRLIAKVKKLGWGDGDVFIISGETGVWKVGSKEFPDLESAERHVDVLTRDSKGDFTVIIDDITPEYLKGLEERIRESDRKRNNDEMRRKQKEARKLQRKEKKRRIREKERLEKERRERQCLEKEQFMRIDKDRQML